MLIYAIAALPLVVFIFFLIRKSATSKDIGAPVKIEEVQIPLKKNYGKLRIYFGSETGTAAKIAQTFGEEANQKGFEAEVIDLKETNVNALHTLNGISVFFLANAGEGLPPQNALKFMNHIRGIETWDELEHVKWQRINFTVFGLGNSQYEHYNITGIDTDRILQGRGSRRIYKLGLGDDNSSLEDDLIEWKKGVWQALKEFRQQNPEIQQHIDIKTQRKISEIHSNAQSIRISNLQSLYANFRFYFDKNEQEEFKIEQSELDFKTKGSLKAEPSNILNFRQLRQDQNDGSTMEFEVELPEQPDYQTAGNIALYPHNDPKIVEEIIDYFNIKPELLHRNVKIEKVNQEKKLKLNFVPTTLYKILQESIDLQGKLSKSVLKKLAKFQSDSPNYFLQNSAKNTEEFKRITEKTDAHEWYYLIRIVRQHRIKLSLQDFIQLSDSIAPRLFTIASHYKTQKNPVVAASITENGLISKYFLLKPQKIRAELRKSAFVDAMKWKKVIFISAGTGFAPFRAYLQEKQYFLKQREEGGNLNVPIISLYFGCKHENGDFIYKDQILDWKNRGIIDRLHLAFSRDTDKKVYVQDLLKREEVELAEFGHCEQTAIYICGSLAMGHAIVDLLSEKFGGEAVQKMEAGGRIVKQLW